MNDKPSSGRRRAGRRMPPPHRRRSSTVEGELVEVRHVGTSKIPLVVIREDAGAVVMVAALGILRSAVKGLEPGMRVRYREMVDGRRTLTQLGGDDA